MKISKYCTDDRKTAFTMAEVLITLGIIGVVAAMTLPTLLNSALNKQLEAGLKKNYSVIQQAFDMYQAETGERLLPEVNATSQSDTKMLQKKIMPYFKVLKDCGIMTTSECIPYMGNENMDDERNYNKYKTFSGNILQRLDLLDDGQFIISDGSIIMFEDNATLQKLISVDVNGYKKKPNRWGHDLFTFQLMTDGKILPMGAEGTYYTDDKYCSAASSEQYNGIACTYKALTDKDYFTNLPK